VSRDTESKSGEERIGPLENPRCLERPGFGRMLLAQGRIDNEQMDLSTGALKQRTRPPDHFERAVRARINLLDSSFPREAGLRKASWDGHSGRGDLMSLRERLQ
jgi:hypothetical protein